VLTALVGLAVLRWLDAGAPSPRRSREVSPSLRVAVSPMAWVLGAAYLCLKLIRYSLLFWLPYFLEQLGYSAERAGYLSTSFELGGILGAILGGWLYDRAAHRRGLVMVALSAALAMACFVYPRLAALGPVASFAAMVFIGFALFGPDALISSVAPRDVGGDAGAATAAGVINGLGSVGTIAQGALTSAVVSRFGLGGLFHGFVGLAATAALVLVPYALRSFDDSQRSS
jgi:sugar phosphate permease